MSDRTDMAGLVADLRHNAGVCQQMAAMEKLKSEITEIAPIPFDFAKAGATYDRAADALEVQPSPPSRGGEVDYEYRLAVAYQVVGSLLDHIGVHDSIWGQKLLDYFAPYPDATDPLPFAVPTAHQPVPQVTVDEATPEMIDTMAHFIAESWRGNPAMGGPLSCHISEMHRRLAGAALRGIEAYVKKWPSSIQPSALKD